MSTDVKASASERSVRNWLPAFSQAAGIGVALLGVLVLAGWAGNVSFLIRLAPGFVAMNPLTAVTFIFAGIALRQQARRQCGAAPDALALTLAAVVALVGAVKLAQYLFSFDFPIDQFLFRSKLGGSEVLPRNEMAPNTALCFFFSGLALALLDVETGSGFRPAQALILTTGTISLVALLGYCYRVLFFYRVGSDIPMALGTAIGFGVCTLGGLAARPDRGVMRVITSPTTGGAMARRLLPMAILVPAILGALRLYGERANYFSADSGVSIFTVSTIIVFTALIWWNAKLLYLADIERQRAEQQLRRTSSDLARSNTDLQQFAYVASHDLSEPLRTMSSFLQLLRERCRGKLDKESEEFIELALDGAHRMRTLINDLLAYSRVDLRGGTFAPTNSEQALEAALVNLKVALEETGATVVHQPLPTVKADAVQLTQVFQNLIGNAIKFHGQEPPRVETEVQQRDGEWIFSVRDNGIGIDPKHFNRIFEIFQRLHTRQEYSGTGIGLAICKRIIERHGGRMWVESKPGEGSAFFFTLPVMKGT